MIEASLLVVGAGAIGGVTAAKITSNGCGETASSSTTSARSAG
jgi:ketopantoate reductase